MTWVCRPTSWWPWQKVYIHHAETTGQRQEAVEEWVLLSWDQGEQTWSRRNAVYCTSQDVKKRDGRHSWAASRGIA